MNFVDESGPSAKSGHQIIRMQDAARMVGLSAKHIRTLEKQGKFPERVQLGPRSVGYRLKDLESWIDGRRVSKFSSSIKQLDEEG